MFCSWCLVRLRWWQLVTKRCRVCALRGDAVRRAEGRTYMQPCPKAWWVNGPVDSAPWKQARRTAMPEDDLLGAMGAIREELSKDGLVMRLMLEGMPVETTPLLTAAIERARKGGRDG